MTYADIIYPPLVDLIEEFVLHLDQALSQNENDVLQGYFDGFVDIRDSITNTYAESASPCLSAVALVVGASLAGFTHPKWDLFNVLLLLSSRIEDDGSINLTNNLPLNESQFALKKYDGSEPQFQAFGYFNLRDPQDSFGYINLLNLSNQTLMAGELNIPILALFLFLFSADPSIDTNDSYIVYRSDAQNKCAAQSALMLLATSRGLIIHEEKICAHHTLPTYFEDRVTALDAYSQFEETLIILSEINSRKDILGKFLGIYHVIESFMFKIPIVNLGNHSGGNIFSIRDFRNLYRATEIKESEVISELFHKPKMGAFWTRNINGLEFNGIIENRALALEASTVPGLLAECISFIKRLGIEDLATLSGATGFNAKRYANFLYKVRCAIVHNKETELHISHFNLNDATAQIIDGLLIQPLLLLIYDLLTDNASRVWYGGPELKLYKVGP